MPSANNSVAYVGNIRFPTEKAHGLQVAQVASALGSLRPVTLYVPKQKIAEDAYSYYGVSRTFSISYVPAIRISHLGSIAHIIETLVFLSAARRVIPVGTSIYSRELFAPLFFPGVTIELHYLNPRMRRVAAYLLSRAGQIVVKTEALKDDVATLTGRTDCVVLPNAVAVDRFSIPDTRAEARAKLSLPLHSRIAMYCGSLQKWKGVSTFIEALELLPDTLGVVVGGTSTEHAQLKASYPNAPITYIPHQSYERIPLYLRAADVLVLPNTATEEVSTRYTSPLKLLEYLASGTPVAASAIPTIESVAGSEELWLAEPDNPRAFAEVISTIMENPDEAARRAQNGLAIANGATWEEYARRISDIIP